ncbi:MAG: bifunctional alpha,alpha-trehalose-phosphate synthase (UDP-forming)/trehalose-phosphatase [Akkermansiaceae bacterium]|jgi:trehalose 6-phosphate synthase/phosphatase
MPKTILVSNRLPVRINAHGIPERTTGGLASALEAAETDGPKLWVGWTGGPEEEIEDRPALSKQLRSLDIEPVFLSKSEVDGFYEGYSNSTLWPLLHGMLERAQFDHKSQLLYQQANEKFADAIVAVAEDDDIVWIHDYHLFLLPAMLRRKKPGLRIGFFLHTPFPSSDILRTLPARRELLLGLLGADLIGFHTYNYLRHFRSSLLRILGIETEHDSLYHLGRKHQLGVFPIGHNRKGFHEAMATDTFLRAQTDLAGNLRERKLVLNVERLDYTKGLPQKLAAIRHFLETNPEQRERVMFLIIAVPSRQNVEEYADLTEEVQREVGAINGDFGTVGNVPVHFLHRGFPPEELAAFYSLADVCLVTPLIDGMNLVAKEFIDCKQKTINTRPGVLILSEFAGAAAEMSHATLVNPYAIQEVSEALSESLKLPPEEMWSRTEAMQNHLAKNDAGNWANRFLNFFNDPAISNGPTRGLGRVERSLKESHLCGKRLSLFLDYDGTLREFTKRPQDAIPDAGLLPLLHRLREKADISIVSGRPMEFLDQHFGGQGFNLVAEHGYRWSRVEHPTWALTNPHVDISWKELILPQLEQIAALTPGSHIEEKQSALVWHYRSADPEFGLWQAQRLLVELTELTASLPVSVHHGKMIVEIASQQVNKGRAVQALIHSLGSEVALTAGDDQTDESMFSAEPTIDQFHTIHIGDPNTRASHVTTFDGFRTFLENLAESLHA